MRFLPWFHLALPCIVILGCGTEDGGSKQPTGGESPWAAPASCEELFVSRFEATGGDPRGTWLPVQLCYLLDSEMERVVGPSCDAEIDLKVVNEDDLTSFWIGNGVCEAKGTGRTSTETISTPYECLAGDPDDTCVDPMTFPTPSGADIKFGHTTCHPNDEAGACVCERVDEWGAAYVFGRFPCSIEGNVIVQGTRGAIKYEFSVEGDYLIRRLVREPVENGSRPDGSVSYEYHFGFQVFRRQR